MEINNAFDARRGASGGASRAEPLYANAGIVIPEKGAVRGFIFPLSSFLSSPAVLGEPGTFTQFQAGALERLGQLTR